MRPLVALFGTLLAVSAAAQELVLEPATLRATVADAARAWGSGEVDLSAWDPALDLAPDGPWRVAVSAPLTVTERLSLALSLVPGEWTWTRTAGGVVLRPSGDDGERMAALVLARETGGIARRGGETLVETLRRLAAEHDLDLAFGADVERALPDGGRATLARETELERVETLGALLDRLLAPDLRREIRGGRVIVVSRARAAALEEAEAVERDLRARLRSRTPVELRPAATVGDVLDRLRAALEVPVLLDPAVSLDRARAAGVSAAGRVPTRTLVRIVEQAAEARACVVGNALLLATGERARVLGLGPWGDALLEDELRRWPLALPPAARRLEDAPALIENEGLSFPLEGRWRTTLARFDMELARPRAGSCTVAEVLDRLASACGAGGWHVHRGEIRLGPTLLDDR